MTNPLPTTGNMLLSKSNGQAKPYLFRDGRLAQVASRVFSKFKELQVLPAPKQNPFGFREIDQRAIELGRCIYENLAPLERIVIAKTFDASKYSISCPNEDGYLAAAVVSLPALLDYGPSDSNLTEKAYANDKPDRLVATMQHFWMVARMLDNGTFIHMLDFDAGAKQLVFVRDSIFAIDGKLCLGNMKREDRRAETEKFTGNLVRFADGAIIEGGNVVLGKDCIFLGINSRTNMAAYEELKATTDREVIPIKISDEVIHLDCIFLPKEPNGGQSLAFFYPKLFLEPAKAYEIFASRYGNVFEIPEGEAKSFPTNVLKMDSGLWLANPNAQQTLRELEKAGIKTDLLDFHEITKSEAAYRCCFAATVRFSVPYSPA